ncbi:Hypothetical predicted protein [Olea europaea subsp. europaea]|uniref:Uncharacterized protein n=1 Tax=Olea europaea subsp. europaea TaxID=158383 RepID=A0A8S0PZP5_OLEEU|nr:Hypothetical predicted protein [Olea europaea subsp. europaea]
MEAWFCCERSKKNIVLILSSLLFAGRNGKLITKAVTHISSSDTIFKSEKTEGNKDHTKSKSDKISVTEENLPTNSSTVTDEKQQPVPEPYPDILDIAGMDYSQARRKPPIHN